MNSQNRLECIDIGANLTSKQFKNDVDDVIVSAKNASVTKIILTGTSLSGSEKAARLCERYPGYLTCTAGIHPHDAKDFDPIATIAALNRLYQMEQVVAVGECGLDFNRDFSPRDQQRSCFEAQIELAVETQLPLFLHERDAHEEFLERITENRNRISRGVVHCFTGTQQQASAYLELDLHLGITGWICDERRGKHLREVVKSIPVNRLMIETDAPYLAPRDYRPKIQRNEPKYLPHILQTVAQCRNENPLDLAEQILQTTHSFFGLA